MQTSTNQQSKIANKRAKTKKQRGNHSTDSTEIYKMDLLNLCIGY